MPDGIRPPMPDAVYETLVTALDHFEEYLQDHGDKDYSPEELTYLKRRVCEAHRWLG